MKNSRTGPLCAAVEVERVAPRSFVRWIEIILGVGAEVIAVGAEVVVDGVEHDDDARGVGGVDEARRSSGWP